jgi:hypothetical protein
MEMRLVKRFVNILAFHIFTDFPVALVVAALWFLVFLRARCAFSSLFVANMPEQVSRLDQSAATNAGD